MGGLISYLFGPKEKKPIKNPLNRLVNIAVNNFRGILGTLFFVIICIVNFKGERSGNNLAIMWCTMFFFLIIQPVHIPVVGIVPIFFMPLTGVMDSTSTTECYYGAGIAFYIIGGWLVLLLNNSGYDRRLILWILCPSKKASMSNTMLLLRSALASYLLSALSSRLIVTTIILQYLTKPLINLHSSHGGKSKGAEPNYNTLRYILCNTVASSSVIGGLAIPHSSFGIMALRAIVPGGDYIYNFMDYCIFAVPTTLAMLVGNLAFNIVLVKLCLKARISPGSQTTIRNELLSAKTQIPKKITLHEILSIFFLFVILLSYVMRFGLAFSVLGLEEGLFPKWHINGATDATIATFYVLILHIIPKSYGFLKYFNPKTKLKKHLPPLKPESTILFWKFIDKNTNYSYFLLMGASIVIIKAIEMSKIDLSVLTNIFEDKSHCVIMIMLCGASTVLSNIMSCIGVIVCLLPLIVSVHKTKTWAHFGCLAIAMAAQFGFCSPFLHTPSYLVKHYGKVPLKKQAKFGIGSVFICCAILCAMLCFYAPVIFHKGMGSYAPAVESNSTLLL